MIFGLAGVAGLAGLLLSNPRRKTRKVRRHGRKAVRRRTVKRGRVTRRGAYKYRVMVTKREAAVIRSARSTRMSAIAAKRKLTAIGDQFLGGHYKTNPAYAPMWMTAAERSLIKSARSAAMKLVASRRGRRSTTALEGAGEGYESYSMDNPRRRRAHRRRR